MADEITNTILLEHMQGMKNDLQEQIGGLRQRIDGVENGLQGQFTNLAQEMRQGFEDARLHRQALQDDLEATMRVQGKHAATLSRITRS
ncbi:MAG: hypothetical protein AAB728_04550 [Patescibacteria group bacterium]